MGTCANKIRSATWLNSSAIGIEAGLSYGLIEAQATAAGMNGFNVFSVVVMQTQCVHVIIKKWGCRVQTNDLRNFAVRYVLASCEKINCKSIAINHDTIMHIDREGVVALSKVKFKNSSHRCQQRERPNYVPQYAHRINSCSFGQPRD